MDGTQTRTLIRGNHASREFLHRMFELRQEGVLVDVELLADTGERGIKAHRLLLAACSPYFNRQDGEARRRKSYGGWRKTPIICRHCAMRLVPNKEFFSPAYRPTASFYTIVFLVHFLSSVIK